MKRIAIIPARSGSKRIPKKNIKAFLGKPIIAYSMDIAKNSHLFDEIMVSTEDKEIADLALSLGASVPFLRSTKNADDFATLADVVDEVLAEYKKKGNVFDIGCCMLPTAPLISNENLSKGLEILMKNDLDSVRPIVKFGYPIQRAFKFHPETHIVNMFYPEHLKTRSQDLEAGYHDSGQFYWFVAERGLRGAKKGGFEITEMECQDIDSEMDWMIAELKYQFIYRNHNRLNGSGFQN